MLVVPYYKGENSPSYLRVKLTEVLYVPWIGQGHSFFHGKANASRSAYVCHLEGSFPPGGEFVEPFSVQDSPQDQVPCPELPTMHKPLVIVSECLVVTFISDCNSPPPFINEIHIISSQLFLHRLIKCLDPW